jgi:two-component system, cell cycle sensor histidine kinase and response regulator CckA
MFRMDGCSGAGELIGTQLSSTFDLADPRSLEFFRAFVRSGYRTVELESFEFDRHGAAHWFVNNLLGVVEDGRLTAIWGTQRDVTEHRLSEELVRATRDRLEAVVEASPLPIVVLGMDGDVVTWNRAAELVFGWTAEETVGRRLPCVPEDRQGEYDAFRAEVLGGRPFTGRETVRVRKDGTRIDVSISTAPLRDATGRPVALVALYVDISGRKRAEEALRHSQEQLRQAQKMEAVGRLAGGIAHDFNNLLSAILSYSEMVMADLSEGHPSRQDLEQIRQAGARAAELTHQLLAFSRRQLLQLRPLNLNAIVAGVDRMLRRVIGEDILLETVLAHPIASTRGDAGQLEQVLMNLAVNARDAMPDGGRLRIDTSAVELDRDFLQEHPDALPGRYVKLTIADNGSGMEPEVAARAFEPFFTTKHKGEGTGLGLATVYGIVTGAGGLISLYSEPGEGTVFRVFLPAADSGAAVLPGEHAVDLTGRGESVLLVEDEDAVRTLAKRILTEGGYQVSAKSRGREALELLEDRRRDCDLLITDVVMPGMRGVELAHRAQQLRPGLPVLMMSGYTTPLAEEDRRAMASSPLLEKPFSRRDLLEEVRALLDREGEG